MDSGWHDEDHDEERRELPKVKLAGELDVSFAGHQLRLIGEDNVLRVSGPTLRSLFALDASSLPAYRIGQALRFGDLAIDVQLRSLPPIRVFPNPVLPVGFVSRLARQLAD